ncbi:MAG TPA: VanW family protein [Gaiellaceae bacterium]|nr:VanW family protein [Gaiellaceae bacterium]
MRRGILLLAAVVAAAGVTLGLVFAGSPTKIAGGVRIDGIDVGGLEATAARALLEHRADALAGRPIVFVAAGHRFAVRPNELGVESDWKAAVDSAQRQGDGFGPLRGFRRLDVDFFGADVTPPTTVLTGALQYELNRIAKEVDRLPVDASIVRRGLAIVVLPARTGVRLDRSAAAQTMVEQLSSLDRTSEPVQLPLRTTQPRVRVLALARAAAQARLALSAPVRLALGPTRWLVRPERLAQLLELPSGGETALRIGGPAADSWLQQLGTRVETAPRDATWAVSGPHVRLVPAKPGLQLDAVRSAEAVLHAALRRRVRIAQLVVEKEPAKRTTAQAERMGINALVSSYTTIYGGVPNRVHNVQLVAHLVNDKLIAPGETFSFNKTTGERNAAKGFLEAPVIVNGELTTGLGGGVCQVSTTVFNAAFEAGVQITERTNHALYISHYPQGRDATVDYPDVDLRFVNDTKHWLLLRTFVGPSSLTVSLYGTPTGRKVVSTTSPLVVRGKTPVKKTVDPTLKPGEKVIDDPGEPAMTTSVTRNVYAPDGKLLFHNVWSSSYRASPELVRVGPKKKHAKAKKPAVPATTTTETTTTPPHG